MLPTVSDTIANPSIPSASAAAGLRSITRPWTNGPRSLIRTAADRPLLGLTTVICLPNGRVRCAAVMSPGFICSPFAVAWSSYTEAMPESLNGLPLCAAASTGGSDKLGDANSFSGQAR